MRWGSGMMGGKTVKGVARIQAGRSDTSAFLVGKVFNQAVRSTLPGERCCQIHDTAMISNGECLTVGSFDPARDD